jgi:hypothetical protein
MLALSIPILRRIEHESAGDVSDRPTRVFWSGVRLWERIDAKSNSFLGPILALPPLDDIGGPMPF